MLTMTTIRIHPDLVTAAKVQAAVQGISFSEVVRRAIAEWIDRHGKLITIKDKPLPKEKRPWER